MSSDESDSRDGGPDADVSSGAGSSEAASEVPRHEQRTVPTDPALAAEAASEVPRHERGTVLSDPALAAEGASEVPRHEQRTVPTDPALAGVVAGRYEVKELHGQGGMGEVWLTEDLRLGREVALKRLRRGHPELRGRFLVEAQIAGQLEHPGVVPVHDLGDDCEGSPFYVMKFVRGQTLRDAIAEYHSGHGAPGVPRELQWLRLLEAFVDLCRTVGYAHSHGVLHRDLKPDNVILGQYGETLVIDWGLAKSDVYPDEPILSLDSPVGFSEGQPGQIVMPSVAGGEQEGAELGSAGRTAPAEASRVQLTPSVASEVTSPGALLGTPAYMAPEVAEGHIREVDRTTDVYLLGGTLYEILTGQPPRQGSSAVEIIQLARTATPKRPQEAKPGVPRALEAICLKAMSRRRDARYRSAMELAEDVRRYMAAEPVSAYPEGLVRRSWRWCKRHRRVLTRTAVALLVVGMAMFAWRLHLLDRLRREVAAFRQLADEASFYAANTDPISENTPYYDPAKGEAAARAALAVARGWGGGFEGLPLAERDRAALREDAYGVVLLLARAVARRPPRAESAREALALLDQWDSLHERTRSCCRLRSQCHRTLGDDAAADEADRRADDPTTAVTALDHFLLGEECRSRAAGPPYLAASEAKSSIGEAVEQYRAALEREPRHYWAQFQLGRCYLNMGRGAEAVEALSTCVALRPECPWSYSTRGLTFALLGRFGEALRDLDKAVSLDPSFRPARLNRGLAYSRQGDYGKALDDFGVVLEPPEDQKIVLAAYYRGEVHARQGHTRAALNDFSRVIAERPNFHAAYLARAQLHFGLGADEQALEDLRSILRIGSDASTDSDSWRACHSRGKRLALLSQDLPGRGTTAAAHLAVQELQKAVDRGGQTPEVFVDLGLAWGVLQEHRQAVDAYSRGLELAPKDTQLLNVRGWAYVMLEEYPRGYRDFVEAVRLDPAHDMARAGLGYVCTHMDLHEEALRHATQALRQWAGDPGVLYNIACIYGRLAQGDGDPAQDFEELAMGLLRLHAALWRREGCKGPPPALLLRMSEKDFPESMRSRPEFQELLSAT